MSPRPESCPTAPAPVEPSPHMSDNHGQVMLDIHGQIMLQHDPVEGDPSVWRRLSGAGGRHPQDSDTPRFWTEINPFTLHPTPCTITPKPYTLHHYPYTLHPARCTTTPQPYTLHPTRAGLKFTRTTVLTPAPDEATRRSRAGGGLPNQASC